MKERTDLLTRQNNGQQALHSVPGEPEDRTSFPNSPFSPTLETCLSRFSSTHNTDAGVKGTDRVPSFWTTGSAAPFSVVSLLQ